MQDIFWDNGLEIVGEGRGGEARGRGGEKKFTTRILGVNFREL